jgi:DMSO/TMAO reductase YedYZ heme-binding membrane subunit
MSLLVSLVIAVAFTAVFHKPLQRVPWLFYILALAVCAASVYFTYSPAPNQVLRSAVFVVQKGQIGFSLFAVVMFMGVFDRGSAIRRALTPVRAELSIIASILIFGHLMPYAINYLSLALGIFSLRPPIVASLLIAVVLLVLVLVLAVTSVNFIKKRMNAERWKTVQRFAYPFFGLIFFHLLGYMVIPALGGSSEALLRVSLYFVIFVAYAVLRLRRASLDRKAAVRGHEALRER